MPELPSSSTFVQRYSSIRRPANQKVQLQHREGEERNHAKHLDIAEGVFKSRVTTFFCIVVQNYFDQMVCFVSCYILRKRFTEVEADVSI